MFVLAYIASLQPVIASPHPIAARSNASTTSSAITPRRRLGDARACCLSRPVLGTTPVQGSPWLPRSVSELAEFPCDAHHSCSSSVGNGLGSSSSAIAFQDRYAHDGYGENQGERMLVPLG